MVPVPALRATSSSLPFLTVEDFPSFSFHWDGMCDVFFSSPVFPLFVYFLDTCLISVFFGSFFLDVALEIGAV